MLTEAERLASQVAGRSAGWYAATTADGRTRAAVLAWLVAELARLGAAAGTGQPAGTQPPQLGDEALTDQILVLAAELADAPRAADVAAPAEAAVRAARAQL